MDKPLLYLGLDVGVRRDSTALAAVFYHHDWNKYGLWGFRCWAPGRGKEVRIADATDLIVKTCAEENVAGLFYDESQYISEAQRLRRQGLGRILNPVNQMSEGTLYSNCLKGHLDDGDLVLFADTTLRNHFKWCNVEVGERGWRIRKQKQTRHIDGVVAVAMALYGAGQSQDFRKTVFEESRHIRSLLAAA